MTGAERVSMVKVFSQEDFDDFARLSGDDNPIHTDPDFCANTRFGRTVAHGLLLCSVLRGLLDRLAPGARLKDQAVMFPAPTYAGEAMRFSVSRSGQNGTALDMELEVQRVADGVVTCTGHARLVS